MPKKLSSSLKPMIRIIAFDDGYFTPRLTTHTSLVGIVYRLDGMIEGLLHSTIEVDSLDSTNTIIKMISSSRFKLQIAAIMLAGINFAGFNIVDVEKLHKKLKVPVVIVFRKKPNLKKINSALKVFRNSRKRISLIKKGGKIHSYNNIHFQCKGCKADVAKQLIKKTVVHSNMPEPARIAHIVASGVTSGESKR